MTRIPVEAPNPAALPIQYSGAHTSQGNATPSPQGSPPAPLQGPPPTTQLGNTRPRFKAYQKKTSKPGGYSPTYILDKEDIKSRRLSASSRNITRTQEHQARKHSTLKDYWPTFIPASLSVRPPGEPRPLLLPRSLPSMGWKPDPTFVIRRDPIKEASYPFPHSPPGSPHPEDELMSSTNGQPPTPSGKSARQGIDPIEAPSSAGPSHKDNFTIPQGEFVTSGAALPLTHVPPTNTILTFLTINAQTAGTNSPSLSDVVTMLDDHSPDILFFTDTPLHTRSGVLLHVLRNRGFRIHYHKSNALSPPDTLPEARIPAHLTHAGGGS